MEKSFILCGRRIKTMRERLGDACSLIDNEQWLGMFRNRQINYEKEFNQSVRMVKLMRKAGKMVIHRSKPVSFVNNSLFTLYTN